MDKQVVDTSNEIIAYLTWKKNVDEFEKNILVKTYLRRGFSEERMEKFKQALTSFGVAKLIEPHNMQAVQGA